MGCNIEFKSLKNSMHRPNGTKHLGELEERRSQAFELVSLKDRSHLKKSVTRNTERQHHCFNRFDEHGK